MKERLLEFLGHKRLRQSTFEQIVGLSHGFVNKIGDSIREKSLEKIFLKFPELNKDWLKVGIGNMLNNSNQENILTDNDKLKGENEKLKKEKDDLKNDLLDAQKKIIQLQESLSVKTIESINKQP